MSSTSPPHSKADDEQGLPAYDHRAWLPDDDSEKHERFARLIVETIEDDLARPVDALSALDIGSGNGLTTIQLARQFGHVTGIELSGERVRRSEAQVVEQGLSNVSFRSQSVYDLNETERYDVIILDNVLEHLPDQLTALKKVSAALKIGGILYLLVPNRLWPIEVHYRLPFLSYLPLPLANVYLRLSGRGSDYTDASYMPTYFGMRRLLNRHKELSYRFVLPKNVELAAGGGRWYYRWGVAAIRKCPWLWSISKAFLVVAVKQK